MSLACLAHVNFLLHIIVLCDVITEQINDDDDDNYLYTTLL